MNSHLPEGVAPKAWKAIGATQGRSGDWEIPERDASGEVVGWSVRKPDGTKSFRTGGKRGLTLAWPLPSYAGSSEREPVFVVEGASDAAALHGLGLCAVGRPSAHGGADVLAELLVGRHVCVLGERDGTAGETGARRVAARLTDHCASVRAVLPPEGVKDARAWVIAGATKDDVLLVARSARPVARVVGDESWTVPAPLIGSDAPSALPIERVFPSRLADVAQFLSHTAEELQVPVDLPAMLTLPVVSAAISGKFIICPRDGWTEPPPIWTITILESGERKSAVFRRMVSPVTTWERNEAARLGPEIAAQRERREIAAIRRIERRREAGQGDDSAASEAIGLAKDEASSPEISPPTLLCTEATSEGLVRVMVENGERALIASPEADALDVMMGRYDDRGRPNMGIWLAGYAGDPVKACRRGRPTEALSNPYLSVALCVQPEGVRGLLGSAAANGRGLNARFLKSAPRGRVGYRAVGAPPVPAELTRQYESRVRRLLDRPVPDAPYVVRLCPEADAMLREFEAGLERRLRSTGDLHASKAWGGKLAGNVARIALTLHCFGHDRPQDALVLELETMAAALNWVPYLVAHELAVVRGTGADPTVRLARGILGWLARSGETEFSRRDCFTACRGTSVAIAADIDAPLMLIEDLGYIRATTTPSPGPRSGRPPSPRYAVNPLWDREVV
jgi:replicative DNA helicase